MRPMIRYSIAMLAVLVITASFCFSDTLDSGAFTAVLFVHENIEPAAVAFTGAPYQDADAPLTPLEGEQPFSEGSPLTVYASARTASQSPYTLKLTFPGLKHSATGEYMDLTISAYRGADQSSKIETESANSDAAASIELKETETSYTEKVRALTYRLEITSNGYDEATATSGDSNYSAELKLEITSPL